MRYQRLGAAAIIGLAACMALSACGSTASPKASGTSTAPSSAAGASGSGTAASSGGAASGSSSAAASGSAAAGTSAAAGPTVDGAGKTLTIWVMDGDYTTATLDAINAEFTKQTGAKVNLQVQQWDGITTKISTALATSNPPDVLDLGNTQVASFAANGGLLDLTADKSDLEQGQTWLGGLVDPATVDGKLYAVPGFAGARAVIYNKTMWSKAGITSAPTTFAELTADIAKLKAANTAPDFSPIYFPGQYWYVGMQFVWDAGGEIATESNGKWTAGFQTPQAQAGLTAFKEFQNSVSSPASRTLNTDKPDQNQIFADGKAAAIISTSGFIATILKDNPKLKESDIGSFPLPGKSGKAQPVMLGGSDWGIAAKSANSALAKAWVKIAASPEVQSKWVFGHDTWIPNSIQATKAASASVSPQLKGFFDAALNSKATPASPNWAQLEGNNSINTLFSSIASGSKSVAAAAAAFDSAADSILNASN